MSLLNELIDSKIVMIYRGLNAEQCVTLSQALMQTGIKFFEVTMNSDDALGTICLLKKELGPEAYIGAGTVLNVEQVELVAEAGASYVISPNVNVDVIHRTKQLGMLSIPGAFTATEIAVAWDAGADMVKVFPINVVGAEYLMQIRGPLDHIPYMPSGGITLDLVKPVFEAGAAAIGIGVHLLGKELVDAMDIEGLKKSAQQFIDASTIQSISR